MKIAISGKRFSGKSTFAEELTYFGFKKIALADAVKQELIDTGQATLNELLNQKEKFRDLLQKWGDGRRQEDKRHWIDILLNEIGTYEEYNTRGDFVLDDLRYLNEAVALKNAGFFLVRLDCDYKIRATRAELRGTPFTTVRGGYDENDHHISEVDLDDFKYFDYRVDVSGMSAKEIRRLAQLVMCAVILKGE